MNTIKKPLIIYGWLRAIIYLLVIFLILAGIELYSSAITNQITAGTEQGDDGVVKFGVLYALETAIIFACTWLIMKFINRQPFVSLGFQWTGFSQEALLGLCTAMAILGIGALILVLLHYIAFTGFNFDIGSIFIGVGLMALSAFTEELIVRGYVLGNLMESTNKWLALAISALLFALLHLANPGISFIALANIFVAGLLLGLNYIFTRNLWFGIGLHFAWNFLQGPVLGYEVSGLKLASLFQQTATGPALWTGGSFGFEGSLLCIVLIAGVVFGLAFLFKKRYGTIGTVMD